MEEDRKEREGKFWTKNDVKTLNEKVEAIDRSLKKL